MSTSMPWRWRHPARSCGPRAAAVPHRAYGGGSDENSTGAANGSLADGRPGLRRLQRRWEGGRPYGLGRGVHGKLGEHHAPAGRHVHRPGRSHGIGHARLGPRGIGDSHRGCRRCHGWFPGGRPWFSGRRHRCCGRHVDTADRFGSGIACAERRSGCARRRHGGGNVRRHRRSLDRHAVVRRHRLRDDGDDDLRQSRGVHHAAQSDGGRRPPGPARPQGPDQLLTRGRPSQPRPGRVPSSAVNRVGDEAGG